MDLSEIIQAFSIENGDYHFKKLTSGHINATYKVSNDTDSICYVLQNVDSVVFQNVPQVMSNIEQMAQFMAKGEGTAAQFNQADIPKLIPTKAGHSFAHIDGSYWRLFTYISGTTLTRTEHELQAAEAGKMFGNFLYAISGLNSEDFYVTINDFHDIKSRFAQFDQACSQASKERLAATEKERYFVNQQRDAMLMAYQSMTDSSIPQRLVHNDPKLSNILFDEADRANGVIDFDTLMPGYLAMDFGDAIRTICSTTEEDDPNLSKTSFDLSLLRSFTRSFKQPLEVLLSEQELGTFSTAVTYMPFIMGLRMLTDYLNNDIYYSIAFADHNLVRCRNQFKLVDEALRMSTEIHNIISE
jgi:hypothetical protein